MLDLHCHILPGVDDGAASLDEAMAMARFCVRDGITHVVATPHCHRHCRLLRADILPHVARLNEELTAAGVPLAILPGSEVQVTDSAAYRREFEAGLYCHLGDRPAFTLLEFNWKPEQYPADAAELVGWLCGRGTIPIIAHPERTGSSPTTQGGCGRWSRRGVAAGDGRFVVGQPRACPEGIRGSVAPGVPGRGAGDRRP